MRCSEVDHRWARPCLSHCPPLYFTASPPQLGWPCGDHLEDDRFMKQGVDLSDVFTTAVIMRASTLHNCRLERTQASENAHMFSFNADTVWLSSS